MLSVEASSTRLSVTLGSILSAQEKLCGNIRPKQPCRALESLVRFFPRTCAQQSWEIIFVRFCNITTQFKVHTIPLIKSNIVRCSESSAPQSRLSSV